MLPVPPRLGPKVGRELLGDQWDSWTPKCALDSFNPPKLMRMVCDVNSEVSCVMMLFS